MLNNTGILDGRYYIRKQIGAGGYGAVYLAQDSRFSGNNFVAVKKIPQSSDSHDKSFRIEADLLYNLRHPNLPKVSNCFQENGANYIVMDYISGEDLSIRLRKGENFSIPEVLKIAGEVLDALKYLHKNMIFHRDIKPHNIKIDAAGKIFLLDFGTAKGNIDEITVTRHQEQSLTGYTPFYAPLEQVLRIDANSYYLLHSLNPAYAESFLEKKTDARSDIYSLGATIYQLLTGLSMEKSTSTIRAYAVWSGKPDPLKPIQTINTMISHNFAHIIQRSMEVEPENRFQSAAEFHQAISALNDERFDNGQPPLPQDAFDFTNLEELRRKTGAVNGETSGHLRLNIDVPANKAAQPSRKSKILLFVIGLIFSIFLTIAAMLYLWKSAEIQTSETSHIISYSLLVQKMRDGKEYQQPFQSTGQEIFESGYKFTMNFTAPADGFMYIFAEGLDENGNAGFNLIFPTPQTNEGKAQVKSSQKYETGWNEFGGTAGTEKFWMIWSRDKSETAEKSVENAYLNAGAVTDKKTADDLSNYLKMISDDKVLISKDAEKKLTAFKFSGDSVAYPIRLEHR